MKTKEWKDLPESERLKIQKEEHRKHRFLRGWFHGTLKKLPYVPGFREDGFLMENLRKKGK